MNSLTPSDVGLLWSFGGITVALIPFFFYLKNLGNLLKAVRPPNRKMEPGAVWLLLLNLFSNIFVVLAYYFVYDSEGIIVAAKILSYLIALFVAFWSFRVVHRVADSIQAEYESRGLEIATRPTYQVGLLMCIGDMGMLLREVPYIGELGRVAALVFLVGWILHWVQTAQYRSRLKEMSPFHHEDEESVIFKDL